MVEGKMRRVVFKREEEVHRQHIDRHVAHALHFHRLETRQRRRFALAEIDEDQPEIFLRGIAANMGFRTLVIAVAGPFDAMAGLVILPAVEQAADFVALDVTNRQLRAAVRTPKVHGMGHAGLAPIEREIEAHDANRFGVSDLKVFGAVHGMPETAHIASGNGPRTGADEISFTDAHVHGVSPADASSRRGPDLHGCSLSRNTARRRCFAHKEPQHEKL